MSQRVNAIRIQTLTKSQYNLSKNIPEAVPKNKLIPQRNGESSLITPTPLPFDLIESFRASPEFNYNSNEVNNGKKGTSIRSYSEEKVSARPKSQRSEKHPSNTKLPLEGKKVFNNSEGKTKYERKEQSPLTSDRKGKNEFFEERINAQSNEKKSQLHDVQTLPKDFEKYSPERKEDAKYEPSAGKQNNTFTKIQDENILLKNENENLKSVQRNLETELNAIKKHNNQIDFDVNSKITNLQDEKQTNFVLYQHEKAASERLRNLLQEKIEELARKEIEYKNEKERINEENGRLKVKVNDLENQLKYKANENERNSPQQVEENKKYYVQLGRIEAENEFKTKYQSNEEENRSLLLQVQGYKTKSQELDSIIALLKEENAALQQNVFDFAKQVEEWRSKYYQLESVNSSNQLKISEEIRKNMADEITQINLTRTQEKEQFKAQNKQLKNKLGEIENRLIMTCGENERLNFSMKEKEKEIDNLRTKLVEMEQQHASSISNLRNQFSDQFNQRIVFNLFFLFHQLKYRILKLR